MKKRVLISVLSVLVVATLLIGATFAWFTDVEKTDAGVRVHKSAPPDAYAV